MVLLPGFRNQGSGVRKIPKFAVCRTLALAKLTPNPCSLISVSSLLRAGVLAFSGKQLGQQSQQEYPYQDGHVYDQHNGIRHNKSSKNRGQGSAFCGQRFARRSQRVLLRSLIAEP